MRSFRKAVSHVLIVLLAALVVAPNLNAATFTVTNTADLGAGSLRQAILDANAAAGDDRIEFAIPAGSCAANGVCTIDLDSSLPDISDGVVIDGATQPRHGTASSNVCATPGSPSSMRVLVSAATADYIFNLTASTETTIRGLAIAGGNNTQGIRIHTNAGTRVECNHFGIDGPGMTGLGIGDGICIACYGGGGNAIIGTDGDGVDDVAERNVFAGSDRIAININAGDVAFPSLISGNYFGVGADGVTPVGLSLGVYMRQSAALNLVGSDLDGTSDDLERNVFALMNTGVSIQGWQGLGNNNRLVGNWFGLDANGRPVGLTGAAIRLSGQPEDTEVRSNQIVESSTGILVADAANLASTSTQNCIRNNRTGLELAGTTTDLFAENNYWGAADGPSGVGPGSGDSIIESSTGTVDFAPWLTAPDSVCLSILADGFESGDTSAWSLVVP